MRRLGDHKRIVVKIGSALLVDHATGTLRGAWLSALAEDIADLRHAGRDVIVVSSGAIALGRHTLNLSTGALKLEESQAAASVGQIALARAWAEALSAHDITTGQLLLTLSDTEDRRRYLNARATLETLLRLNSLPIINENDTVATAEIRYGDNDRLGARVATMANADCLVLLSDIDGLYTASPKHDANAEHIPFVAQITRDIEKMAGKPGNAFSSGGMATKIEAAKIAVAGGTHMVIASGLENNPLRRLNEGARTTWFAPSENAVSARKTWIFGHLDPHGSIQIDDGAKNALLSGKSLLPAGVTHLRGNFERGDTVAIIDHGGLEIGRGLVAYDVNDARQIIGCKTPEIENVLGYPPRAAMIHRDDMVLRDNSQQNPGAHDSREQDVNKDIFNV